MFSNVPYTPNVIAKRSAVPILSAASVVTKSLQGGNISITNDSIYSIAKRSSTLQPPSWYGANDIAYMRIPVTYAQGEPDLSTKLMTFYNSNTNLSNRYIQHACAFFLTNLDLLVDATQVPMIGPQKFCSSWNFLLTEWKMKKLYQYDAFKRK
jgi:hypothetical protein